MKLILITVVILLIVLTINIRVSFAGNYNITQNEGNIKIRFWGIPLIVITAKFMGNYLNLTRNNKKAMKIKISFKDNSVQFFNDVFHSLSRKLYLQRMDLNANISLENAQIVALISGWISVVSGVSEALISTRQSDAIYTKNVHSKFSKNNIDIGLKFNAYLSLYDLIWSIFVALYKRRVRVYGKS